MPGPVSAHRDDRLVRRRGQRDRDGVAGTAVARRVGEQVADRLMQPIGVAVHHDTSGSTLVVTTSPAPSIDARAAVHGILDELAEVEHLAMQRQRGGLGRGQRRQVVDHPAQPHRLRVQRGQPLRIRLDQAVAQLLEPRLQRGERGAQLVRHVRRHPLARPLGADDVLRRRVEGPGELAELARAPPRRRAATGRRGCPRRRRGSPASAARAGGRSVRTRTRPSRTRRGSRRPPPCRIQVHATVWAVDVDGGPEAESHGPDDDAVHDDVGHDTAAAHAGVAAAHPRPTPRPADLTRRGSVRPAPAAEATPAARLRSAPAQPPAAA